MFKRYSRCSSNQKWAKWRGQRAKNTVSYAKPRGYSIIAESDQTYGEREVGSEALVSPRRCEVRVRIICGRIRNGDFQGKGPRRLKREEKIDDLGKDRTTYRWPARRPARDSVWSPATRSSSCPSKVAKEFTDPSEAWLSQCTKPKLGLSSINHWSGTKNSWISSENCSHSKDRFDSDRQV